MKHLLRLLFAALCIAVATMGVLAAGAQVDDLHVAMTVDQNGTARAEVSLHVAADEPLSSLSIALGADVSGVHVEGYHARVSRGKNQTTVHLADEAGLPTTMDLRLSYTIRNTVQSGSNAQHFSLRLLGGIQEADIKSFSATVQMPAAFDAIPEFYSGYYADGIDNYLTIQVSEDGLLTLSSTESLLAGETLDVKLDTALDYFTLRNVAGRTLLFDRIAMIALALFCLLYWWYSLRSALPAMAPQHQPPLGVEPGTAAMLLTGQPTDLSLMVMGWAASGYVKLSWMRGQKVALTRQMPMGNERNAYEQAVFNHLFSKNPELVCGDKAWKSARRKADKAARHYWNARLYEQKPGRPGLLRGAAVVYCGFAALSYADQVIPSMQLRVLLLSALTLVGLCWGWMLQAALRQLPMRHRKRAVIRLLLCIVVMAVAWRITGYGSVLLWALVLSIFVALVLVFGPKRKKSGVDLLSELLSWRRYLKHLSAEDARQLLQADPQYYYRTLPFAQALGVGRKFSHAFDGLPLDECAFLVRTGKALPQRSEKFRPAFLYVLAIARGERNKPAGAKPAHASAHHSKRPQA